MAYENKPDSGALFSNRNKKNDKAPTLKGTALVSVGDQLIELDIGAWVRQSDKAGKWLALSVKCKGVRPNPDLDHALPNGSAKPDDNDIPF